MSNHQPISPIRPISLISLLLVCLLGLPGNIHAQRIHAFVSSGMTLSQSEGDELKGFKQFGYTGGIGALASISANNRWGLSIEALFSQRGAFSEPDTRYYLYQWDVRSNYIEIPVLLHWQDPNGGMLFGAGLSYGRLVRQPTGIIGFDTNFFIPDTTDKTFSSSDLMVVLDARFTIWRGLQLDMRWQYSLLPIKRDWTFYKYNGYGIDENGNRYNRYITNTRNCYNHSIVVKLIWQF